MTNFNTRTLTGNIGQSSFITDDDEIEFIVQGVNVMNLRPDAVDIPILTNDGIIRSDDGILSTDTTIGPIIDGLDARITTNTNDISTNTNEITTLQTSVDTNTTDIDELQTTVIANTNDINTNTNDITVLQASVNTNTTDIDDLQTTVIANKLEIDDHEIRIEALEDEPAFNIEPITLDKNNNRVGINIAPSTSLHVNGTARVSGNMDVLSNFAIGIAATSGPVLLNVNGLSSFRGASFFGGVSIDGGNVSVADDIIVSGAVRTSDVFTTNINPPEILTIDGNVNAGTNCYLGDYINGNFACFRNRAPALTPLRDFCLMQDSTGRTLLNASAGEVMQFRHDNSVNRMTIAPNGNIGINTDTPSERLHVNGNVNVSGQIFGANDLMRLPDTATGVINRTQIFANTNVDRFIRFRSGGNNPSGMSGVQLSHFDNINFYMFANNQGLGIFQNSTNSSTRGAYGDRLITLNPSGNLGINVSSPTQRLHVDGNALITGSVSANDGFKNQFDNRELSPSDINGNEFRFGFGSYNNNGNAPYADVLHLNSWDNSSGGNTNALMLNKNGFGIRQWQRSFGSTEEYYLPAGNNRDVSMCTYDRPMSRIIAHSLTLNNNSNVQDYNFPHGIGSLWNNVLTMDGVYKLPSAQTIWLKMPTAVGFSEAFPIIIPYIVGINATNLVLRIRNAGVSMATIEFRIVLHYQE